MSWCKQCKVEVLDLTDKCPLCHCILEQTKKDMERKSAYPNVRRKIRKLRFAANCVGFASIVLGTVLVYINWLFRTHIWWSVLVVLALVYINVVLHLAILGNSGYRFKIISMFFAAVLFLLGIDIVTGYRGWSVEFVFPAGIALVDVGILILMGINRRNWQSYLMLQIFMILLSVVPLILIAVDIISVPYVAVGAFFLSVFIFLGTVIIGDSRARTELKRRFHW